ncbi:MAG: DUF1285 domain-containing protein [Pseudomonadales bacterium]|nr:DUF1285 domain-containing protein [Pseudomonadales bacterium]
MAIDLKKIIQSIQSGEQKKLPPVHLWHPEIEGEMDLLIDKNQQWFHEGAAFQRQSLVNLLASVMRRDGDDYFLVTPTEKMKIQVEDVPFSIASLITESESPPAYILLTNTEQSIKLDKDCVWQLRDYEGVLLPYIEVRPNLWARISRPVYYQIIELAQLNEVGDELLFSSAGSHFSLGPCGD